MSRPVDAIAWLALARGRAERPYVRGLGNDPGRAAAVQNGYTRDGANRCERFNA